MRPSKAQWWSASPAPPTFNLVLDDLELPPSRVAMIGDDIEIDVRGAKLMGMQGWLVKTGRFRKEDLGRGIWPDRVLNSVADAACSVLTRCAVTAAPYTLEDA